MSEARPVIPIDIVSDVVCPWCVIGYLQLRRAIDAVPEAQVAVRWRPFELNPAAPAEGENLAEHLAQKYGSTPDKGRAARARLTALGADLGFQFHYTDDMRIYNTFGAHRLLHWAGAYDDDDGAAQTRLKFALFEAYFVRNADISQEQVLIAAAKRAGFNEDDARQALSDPALADAVREEEEGWTGRGVHAVPAVVMNARYLITGAQDPSVYVQVMRRTLNDMAAPAG